MGCGENAESAELRQCGGSTPGRGRHEITTTADLINETRTHLLAFDNQELNRLGEALDAIETDVTYDFASSSIQTGAVLSIDLELMYVWSNTSLTATVLRGHQGSVAATHADDGLIEVNPRFSNFAILRALNAELASLSAPVNGMYRVRTVDLTYTAARSGYDLTGVTDMIGDPISVEGKGHLSGDRVRLKDWRVIRDADTSDFASGKALYLYEGPAPGRAIEVAYKAPFVSLATLADNVTTISFLPDSAHDIPPLGAAARLLAGRESRRAQFDSQPEPRQAADVPPGSNRNAAANLLALRNQRIREEVSRLHAAYPRVRRSA